MKTTAEAQQTNATTTTTTATATATTTTQETTHLILHKTAELVPGDGTALVAVVRAEQLLRALLVNHQTASIAALVELLETQACAVRVELLEQLAQRPNFLRFFVWLCNSFGGGRG